MSDIDGFYGDNEETYYVRDGRAWLVQSQRLPDTRVVEVDSLPGHLRPLPAHLCHDIDVSGCK
jgi:hypothetical protein